MTRRRLELELVRRGLAGNPAEARRAIASGTVVVRGRTASNPRSLVGSDEPIDVRALGDPYVSRGGEKLAAALDRFEVDPAGRRCLDAGASTGGFTDVLLRRGAAHVVAVDVGYGQLAWRLRGDPRVTVLDRTNVRDLRPEALPSRPDLVTADLSFISLSSVVGSLVTVAHPRADLLLLVKPQFEAKREDVEHGGVVADPAVWRGTLQRVVAACRDAGAGVVGVMASPLAGPAGNVEFFLHARAGSPGVPLDLDAAVAEGISVREAS